MGAIITAEELREWSINQDLIDLADNQIDRYINIVSNKIRAKIDEEQFTIDGETYEYPADLKLATISLVDNYYAYFVQLKQSAVTGKRTGYTEKIDDYSITENFDNASAFTFFWIPVDMDILDILKRYMDSDQYGFWNVNPH